MVLKDINLKIVKNEKIAIVGPSGSGKSTLVKLIAGLYSPSNGQVLVNGKNMNELKQESIRSKISVENQNPTIFNNQYILLLLPCSYSPFVLFLPARFL